MYTLLVPALALAAAGLAVGGVAPAQSSPWQEGQPLPALRLPTIDGTRTIDLRSLRGTPTLLIEFASW